MIRRCVSRNAASCNLTRGLLGLLIGAIGLPLVAAEVPIVFVSRRVSVSNPSPTRPGPVERGASGSLLVLEPGGGLRIILDGSVPGEPGLPTDVMDPDVSYDGARIVFSGFSRQENAWRIFEVAADGSGLRQITLSDRVIDLGVYGPAASRFVSYDDLDPCYLPDGRICFVSTRYPGVAPDNRLRATNLYVVNPDGSNVHRITSERFGADTPAVDPSSGQIVYSRWWRTGQFRIDPLVEDPKPIEPGSPGYGDAGGDDGGSQGTQGSVPAPVLRSVSEDQFPGVNSWFFSSVNPDGTGIAMVSGFRLDRELTQAYRPSFQSNGSLLGLFIPRTPILGSPQSNGLRLFHRGPSVPDFLGGPQEFPSADLAVHDVAPPSPLPPLRFVYASVAPLPDGRIVVSGAPFGNPSEFDLHVQLGSGTPMPLLSRPGTAELEPVALTARPVPPVIADRVEATLDETAPLTVEEAFARGGSFTFQVENIHFNAPIDVAIATAPPIGKHLAIEFFMAPQRTGDTEPDDPILIRREEIGPDGKIKVDLPAGVPLFEVLRRPDGTIPIGRDGQIFHVGGMNFNRAGETGKCVGCHAGHSMMQVPEDASWTNLAPSAVARASSSLTGIAPGNAFQPQALIDRRTDPGFSEWAAGGIESESWVELAWTVPIHAREIVVYGPRVGPAAGRTQIRAFTLSTSLAGVERERTRIDQPVLPNGTRVPWNPEKEFDTLVISLAAADMPGVLEGELTMALAEIEVVSKAALSYSPTAFFVRGDADCDSHVNITDAISILSTLFTSGAPFCCGTAADSNDDATINLTDGVVLLNHLFRGGAPPPHPFPGCGSAPDGGFVCDAEACP